MTVLIVITSFHPGRSVPCAILVVKYFYYKLTVGKRWLRWREMDGFKKFPGGRNDIFLACHQTLLLITRFLWLLTLKQWKVVRTKRKKKLTHLSAIKGHTGKSPPPFLFLFPLPPSTWPSPPPKTEPLSLLLYK